MYIEFNPCVIFKYLLHPPLDITVTEAFKGELTFDREAQSQGVETKGYQNDNGVLNISNLVNNMLKNP